MHSRALIIPVAAVVFGALASCQRADASKDGVAQSAPAFTLDESQLIQPIRFAVTDLDASKSACVDLGD